MATKVVSVVAIALLAAACGDAVAPSTSAQPAATIAALTTAPTAEPTTEVPPASGCADVVGVEVERSADGTLRFDVTVSSADTGDEKYADAWEVRTVGGEVVGTRVLAHPHVNEQPFTRSLSGVAVPDGVTELVVAARDSVVGFCGATMSVPVPGAG